VNSEQIALNNGEEREKEILKEQFTDVVNVSREYINKRKQLIVANSIQGNLASIIPYIAAMPLFFAGQVTLGVVSQTAYAYRQLENSFSFILNNIQFFASMKANIDRLGTLMDVVELSHYESAEQQKANARLGAPPPAPA
jgi:putative ATP-binding cassette transporter